MVFAGDRWTENGAEHKTAAPTRTPNVDSFVMVVSLLSNWCRFLAVAAG